LEGSSGLFEDILIFVREIKEDCKKPANINCPQQASELELPNRKPEKLLLY
jgi:hypothetical protein